MLQKLLEAPLTYTTKHSSETTEHLLQKQKKSSAELNDEIDTELVVRSFNTMFYEESFDQNKAVEICKKQLKKNPNHNLFSFALALHQKDPQEKLNYLLIAARSVHPLGEEIAGQAAFELSKFFFESGKYIESQAWLVHAIIMGNPKAVKSFRYGMGGDTDYSPNLEKVNQSLNALSEIIIPRQPQTYPHLSSLLQASFVALTLSNVHYFPITDSYWRAISCYFVRRFSEELHLANCTNNLFSALMLYHDSFLGKIACDAAEASPGIFYKFFLYCAENKIISPDVDKAIMKFLAHYPPQSCELIAFPKMPTPETIKEIPGRSRLFYIFNSGNLYFAERFNLETPIIKVASNIDEFQSHMKPTPKGRILTASELNDIMSQASFTPPRPVYPIDLKIIREAQERLNASSLLPLSYESYQASAAEISVHQPYATPIHYIPQIFVESRYVPPSILPDNTPLHSTENTQRFEEQFPKVPAKPLHGQSMFTPKAKGLPPSQNQPGNVEKALAPGYF